MAMGTRGFLILSVCAGLMLMVIGGRSCSTLPYEASSGPRPEPPKPEPPPSPRRVFSEDQKERARWIMEKASERAKVFEEAGSLVVECREFIHPYDINSRLSWVRQVCDADAVIQGGNARSIFFYDPNGKKFAQADTLRGIRLLD